MGMSVLDARRRVIQSQPHKASKSGAVVDFSTFVPHKLSPVIQINPVQNLNGYAYPWSDGCNKNLFDQNSFGWSTNTTIVYVPIKIGDGTFTISTDFPNNNTKDVFIFPGQVDTGASSSTNGVSSTVPRTVTAVDGYITLASRKNSSRPNPANYNWQIEKGESATDYSPYSNICLIHGFDSANITRTSKNILPGIEQGAWESDGEKIAHNARIRCIEKIRVESGQKYTVSGVNTDPSQGTLQAFTRFLPDQFSEEVSELTWNNLPYTFTVPDNAKFVTIHFRLNTTANITPDILEDAQVEKGETNTSYAAFGTVFAVTFPDSAGTVYGGVLTVNKDGTGQLKATHKCVTFTSDIAKYNSGDSSYVEGWTWFSQRVSASGDAQGYGGNTPSAGNGNGICEIGQWRYNASGMEGRAYYRNNYLVLICSSNKFDMKTTQGKADFYTSIGGSIKVVYKIKTPITYDLTSLQVIEILKGLNNLYADTGDISVEYWTNE